LRCSCLVITAKASLEQEVCCHFFVLVAGKVRLNALLTRQASDADTETASCWYNSHSLACPLCRCGGGLVVASKAALQQKVGSHLFVPVTCQVRLNAGVTLKAEALQPLDGCVIGLRELNLQQQ
jgi:hypothetical protein